MLDDGHVFEELFDVDLEQDDDEDAEEDGEGEGCNETAVDGVSVAGHEGDADDHDDCGVEAEEDAVEEELDEEFVGGLRDQAADPGAEVVHSADAAVRRGIVVDSVVLPVRAVLAPVGVAVLVADVVVSPCHRSELLCCDVRALVLCDVSEVSVDVALLWACTRLWRVLHRQRRRHEGGSGGIEALPRGTEGVLLAGKPAEVEGAEARVAGVPAHEESEAKVGGEDQESRQEEGGEDSGGRSRDGEVLDHNWSDNNVGGEGHQSEQEQRARLPACAVKCLLGVLRRHCGLL